MKSNNLVVVFGILLGSLTLQVEYEYSFIDHGYSEDPAVLSYFTTEAANAYKKALYCIVSLLLFYHEFLQFYLYFLPTKILIF